MPIHLIDRDGDDFSTFSGNWDPTSGSLPANATKGDMYYVSADGAVGGHVFTAGDILISTVDSPSTSTFANNWTTLAGESSVSGSSGGYEFTGAFSDRLAGQSGASDIGTFVQYTAAQAADNVWRRFGFSTASQVANDAPYWTDPAPAPAAGVGLFGGSYMPAGVTRLFDFDFDDSATTGYSNAVQTGSFQYTAAEGSLDFTQCRAGDLALVRFDFNVIPQVANTTVEVGLIWQTRDSSDTPTFTFALTGEPLFFGTGTVGKTYLNRPLLSAYFASNEDVNARALLAIRADQQVQVAPLTTLVTIVR